MDMEEKKEMEFSQIKEQFSELERKEALKKAKLINNSILIRLAAGEITSYACRRIYPEMERKYVLKNANYKVQGDKVIEYLNKL